jgi:hypothetical protein
LRPDRGALGVTSRRTFVFLLGAALVGGAAYFARVHRYPSDRTPEGAYARIAKAVNLGRPRDFFAYLETTAQHAAYTIADYRRKARERILATYPEPERTRLASEHEADAEAGDGAGLFAVYAERRGFLGILRRDLSGVAKVEIQGERATVETVHGTRYAFRRRPENGIWGLTLFTAALVADAEKAARDYAIVEAAAADYARASAAPSSGSP